MIAPLTLALLLTGGPAEPARVGIRFERNFDEALKKARAAGKPILVDFWADWCGWCHRLDQTTYVDPEVVRLSKDFVAVKVDTDGSSKDVAVAQRYDVSSLPTIGFLTPRGRQVFRLNGFQGPGQFPRTLLMAKEKAAQVMGWEDALERNPDDASALFRLAVHLYEQEFYEESRDLLQRAIKVDSHQPSEDRKQARMLLGIIQLYSKKYPEAESVLKEGLALLPASEFDPKMLYVLGRTYVAWGRKQEGREVLQKVVEKHSQAPIARKARETLIALDKNP